MSLQRRVAPYASFRALAATVLVDEGIEAEDPRVEVLGILLRTPAQAVAYIEMRAEAASRSGLEVDRALDWLVRNGYARLQHLRLYGVGYQPTARCLAQQMAAARGVCEQPFQHAS